MDLSTSRSKSYHDGVAELPVRVATAGVPSMRTSKAMSVAWRSVNVSVSAESDTAEVESRSGKGRKVILKGVSGVAPAGKMLALMGATGSGKTTMLSALSNRLEGGAALETGSEIRYGGFAFTKACKRRIGFVEQDDVVTPELTVRQSLTYQARLRIPGTQGAQDARVESVIAQLRLSKCGDTVIGDALDRGISGGERKRLCIGGELLTKPEILFLDEPTSGLDSTTAVLVTKILSELSSEGVTVIASIHQPSSQAFANFSHLCFLHDGETVYFGDAHDAAIEYFRFLGFPCPNHFNPPDYFMEVAVGGLLGKGTTLATVRRDFGADQKDVVKVFSVQSEKLVEQTADRYTATYTTQLLVLSERSLYRLKSQLLTTASFTLIIGLALCDGLLFVNLGGTDVDVFPRVGLGMWFVGTWMFFPVINSMMVFSADRVVVRKELYVGAYRLSAYYIARVTTILPFEFFKAWLFNTIVYCITLPGDASFAQYALLCSVIWLSMTSFYAVGLTISAGVPERHVMTVSIILITFFFGYSGFFVPFDQVPIWLRWVEHGNLFNYAYNLVMWVILGYGSDYSCEGSMDTFKDECAMGEDNATLTSAEVREHFGFNKTPEFCAGMLVLSIFVFHLLAYRLLRGSYSSGG